MTEAEAIKKMKAPGDKRKQAWLGGVIQIWVTRACDLACSGCTQASNIGGNPGMISVEQFEEACISLSDYYGVVGLFGGNAAIHPKFDVLCEIFRKHIPFERRGLWCNNPLGKGKIMRETFNPKVSNLNVHLKKEAFLEFKRDWPESDPFGLDEDSRHSPPWVAMQDMEDITEDQIWELISKCPINQNWSAMIGVFRGKTRGYFCEMAGAQAMLHQHSQNYNGTGLPMPDTGVPVSQGWWKLGMPEFAGQVGLHCFACGIPMQGFGSLATTGTVEQTSKTHADVYKPKRPEKEIQLVQLRSQLGDTVLEKATDYLGNSHL